MTEINSEPTYQLVRRNGLHIHVFIESPSPEMDLAHFLDISPKLSSDLEYTSRMLVTSTQSPSSLRFLHEGREIIAPLPSTYAEFREAAEKIVSLPGIYFRTRMLVQHAHVRAWRLRQGSYIWIDGEMVYQLVQQDSEMRVEIVTDYPEEGSTTNHPTGSLVRAMSDIGVHSPKTAPSPDNPSLFYKALYTRLERHSNNAVSLDTSPMSLTDSNDSTESDDSHESEDDILNLSAMPSLSSNILQELGLTESDMSSPGEQVAINLREKLYIYLRGCSADSTEYVSSLKLLQDLCLFTGNLPSSFLLKNITFDRRDVIGRGGEAVVYQGQMNNQKKVVVREVVLSPRDWNSPLGRKVTKLVHREAITHSLLDHPNILPFLGIFHETTGSPPIMVLPFAERGSVSDLIREGPISTIQFVKMVIGISHGVAYLHSRKPPIVHGDIHPGNVLLDEFGTPFLCDFGLSRIRHEVTRTRTMTHEGGRARFLAPELAAGLTGKFRTSQASDIFALAMTFLNIWTREPPFSEIRNEVKVAANIRKGRRPKRPTINIYVPGENKLWVLLGLMWTQESSSRPSSNTVRDTLEEILLSTD